MSMNQQKRDPYQPLRQFVGLVELKCQELPRDIDHWIGMAAKHESTSKTYQNIIQSSVKPREVYLTTLEKLHSSLMEAIQIIEGKETIPNLDIQLDMPIETMIRKYLQLTKVLRESTENNQSFSQFFNTLLDRISFIRNDLNQTILRCSGGDINYKDAEHQVRVLEPAFEESLTAHIQHRKNRLSELTELVLQKLKWTYRLGNPFKIERSCTQHCKCI